MGIEEAVLDKGWEISFVFAAFGPYSSLKAVLLTVYLHVELPAVYIGEKQCISLTSCV